MRPQSRRASWHGWRENLSWSTGSPIPDVIVNKNDERQRAHWLVASPTERSAALGSPLSVGEALLSYIHTAMSSSEDEYEGQRHACTECGQSFPRREQLTMHRRCCFVDPADQHMPSSGVVHRAASDPQPSAPHPRQPSAPRQLHGSPPHDPEAADPPTAAHDEHVLAGV